MITIDFETRSAVDLLKAGPWRYAEDSTTDVICLAIKKDDAPPVIWLPEKFKKDIVSDAFQVINDSELLELQKEYVIEAHNMEFERAMWYYIMHRRYGFPDLDLDRCYCSAAVAASYNIPRSLDNAGKVLRLSTKKSQVGHTLMLKMCKPRKLRKQEKEEISRWWNKTFWHEQPKQIIDLCKYCCQDVETEYLLSQVLKGLSSTERSIWKLDQIINKRGVYIDLPNIKSIVSAIEIYEEEMLSKVRELTQGAIKSPKQLTALKSWMWAEGVRVKNLQRNTVNTLLKKEMPLHVRKVLLLRKVLAKSSVAKFVAMLKRVNTDQRCRSLFMYHGANTGRFTGKAIQPTNMPRASYTGDELFDVYRCFRQNGLQELKMMYDDPTVCASRCVRGSLMAAPDHRLLCADYSAIEARGNAWLAGEESVLRTFISGRDAYKDAAVGIFGVKYDEVTKEQRQIGKVTILAMGYQGGIGAFSAMAKGYDLDLETLPAIVTARMPVDELEAATRLTKIYLEKNPNVMSVDAAVACDIIKRKWRKVNPQIVKSWKKYEEAALEAVFSPGDEVTYRKIKYYTEFDKNTNKYLCCELPSGRCIKYFNPHISEQKTPWGESKQVVSFWGVNSMTKQWYKRFVYGGLLCENIVQATCRDILTHAMLKIEKAGYPIVLHVYDEIVSEVKEGYGSLGDFIYLMEDAPSWAKGMPIKAEGWEGKRYKK